PAFIEVGSDDASVVDALRPLPRPILPVPFAVAQEDGRELAAGALGRGDDVGAAVAVHVRDGAGVAPRAGGGLPFRRLLEADHDVVRLRRGLEELGANALEVFD